MNFFSPPPPTCHSLIIFSISGSPAMNRVAIEMTMAELCLEILQTGVNLHSDLTNTSTLTQREAKLQTSVSRRIPLYHFSPVYTYKYANTCIHSLKLRQPAPPPSGNKQAHYSIRCQPPAQIQTTGDAPLSLGAEATPFSLSVATSLPPLLPLGILQRQMVP